MKRPMTDEQKAKIQAAREAKAEKRAKVLKVGGWQTFQVDPDNWAIRKGDEGDLRYYPTVADALKAILHERIGEAPSKSIADVLSAVRKAEQEVTRAIAG